jgi:hypothetical protein
MKADYETHGYTDGCRGCNAVRRAATGIPHSAACRTRMEAALAATAAGADRDRQSADRVRSHIDRAIVRADDERSSKRQRVEAAGGSSGEPVVAPPGEGPETENQVPGAPPGAGPEVPGRQGSSERDMSALPVRPPNSTSPGGTPAPVTLVVLQHPDPDDQLMDDTMDRANDPGGASSSAGPINPIDLTMPIREQT